MVGELGEIIEINFLISIKVAPTIRAICPEPLDCQDFQIQEVNTFVVVEISWTKAAFQ